MKVRSQYVTVDFGEPVAANEVQISPDGAMRLLSNGVKVTPDAGWFETSYERAGKSPKVLNRIPLQPEALVSNVASTLATFETLIAIDTNTKIIRNERVSAAAALWAIVDPPRAQFGHMGVVEFRNAIGNPECVAWRLLIQGAADYKPPVGVIVDSELGLLDAINRREVPVEGATLLPDGWTLIYASAERSPDQLPNRLIRECDRRSEEVLSLIADGSGDEQHLIAFEGESFSHGRRWPATQSRA